MGKTARNLIQKKFLNSTSVGHENGELYVLVYNGCSERKAKEI